MVYEPVSLDGSGIYSGGTGRDVGYGKSTQLFKPRFQRFGGRLGAIVGGIQAIGRFTRKYRKPITGIGVVAAGEAVRRYGTSNRKQQQALRARQFNGYRRRRKQKRTDCSKCRCTAC